MTPKTALFSVIFSPLFCLWQTIPLLAEAAGERKPLLPSSIHLKALIIVEVEPFSYKDDKIINGSNATHLDFPQYQGFIPDLLRLIQKTALELDNVTLTFEFDEIAPNSETDIYDETMYTIYDDCNTTANKMLLEDCHRYHILVGDYYAKASRVFWTYLSPSFTTTSVSTIKYIQHQKREVNTLHEATVLQEPVCLLPDSYLD
jgi:ABC-type amino acid transport substrate-binding protein